MPKSKFKAYPTSRDAHFSKWSVERDDRDELGIRIIGTDEKQVARRARWVAAALNAQILAQAKKRVVEKVARQIAKQLTRIGRKRVRK